MKDLFQSSGVNSAGRFTELDAARGIAILMMIVFHTVFDLYFFKIYPVNISGGFWRYFAFSTASLFLLIAGISLSVSHSRAVQLAGDGAPGRLAVKFLKRGAGIFACGLLVTLATWLYLGQGFVIFGILHAIGVSIMLSPLFFRFRSRNILIGVVVIVTGIALAYAGITGPLWLCPIGIHPAALQFRRLHTPFPVVRSCPDRAWHRRDDLPWRQAFFYGSGNSSKCSVTACCPWQALAGDLSRAPARDHPGFAFCCRNSAVIAYFYFP